MNLPVPCRRFPAKSSALGPTGHCLLLQCQGYVPQPVHACSAKFCTHKMDGSYLRTGILSGLSVEAGKPEGVPSPNWGDK